MLHPLYPVQFYLDAKRGLPIIQKDGKLAYDTNTDANPVTVYLKGDQLFDGKGLALYISTSDLNSNHQSIVYFSDPNLVPSDGVTHIFALLDKVLQVTVNGETLVELLCFDDGYIHFGRKNTEGCTTGQAVTQPEDSPMSSSSPSSAPSMAPSMSRSNVASLQPASRAPSVAPSNPASIGSSQAPSEAPSVAPSQAPSVGPSEAPSVAPSEAPSVAPSVAP